MEINNCLDVNYFQIKKNHLIYSYGKQKNVNSVPKRQLLQKA